MSVTCDWLNGKDADFPQERLLNWNPLIPVCYWIHLYQYKLYRENSIIHYSFSQDEEGLVLNFIVAVGCIQIEWNAT